MPQWKDEIEEHSVHGTIEILRNEIEKLLPLTDKESTASLRRVLQILEKATKILTGGDPTFISTTTLDAIESNVSAVKTNFNEIETHAETPDLHETYFSQMEPYLSQILQSLGQIRAVASPLSQNSAFEKLGSIKLGATAQASKIKKVFREEVDEIEESFADIKEELTTVTTSISEEKSRADNLITQFQTEFNSGQKERDAEFAKKLEKDFSVKVSSKIRELELSEKNLSDLVNENLAAFDSKSTASMETLDGHITRAGLVAQSIAQKGLKTEYEATAIKEKAEANKWSWITLGVAIVMIISVAALLIQIIIFDKPFSPETIAPKALLTAILVGVARWTAKLEKRHAEEARKYKQLSLELETIAPFIATLDPSDQQAITKNLVPRYFVGRNTSSEEKSTDDGEAFGSPIQNAGDALKQLVSGKD